MSLTLRNGIWHFRKMVNGTMINRSTKTGNKKLAEQLAATWTTEAVKEIVLNGAKSALLHDVIDEFLIPRQTLKGLKAVKMHMDIIKRLPNIAFKDVKQTDVYKLFNELRAEGYAESTIFVTAGYYNSLVNFAIEHDYQAPKKITAPKKPSGKIRWLTQDEQRRLLEALEPQGDPEELSVRNMQRTVNRELTILLLDTGARYHEIANLAWTQIDLENKVIHLYRGKSSNDTAIYMTNRVYFTLKERFDNYKTGDYVFPEKYNKKGNMKWFGFAVKRAKLSAVPSLPTIHSLRHTAATQWLRNGMSLVEVQHMLGHKDIKSTLVYAHIVETDAARKAADIMNKLNSEQEL